MNIVQPGLLLGYDSHTLFVLYQYSDRRFYEVLRLWPQGVHRDYNSVNYLESMDLIA